MKKLMFLSALAALVSAPLAAQGSAITVGKPLFANDGKRIGIVYRVTSDGTVQLIINGKLVSVPATSISAVDGKFQTSLAKKDVVSAS
jgi:hypothetical protein